MTVDEARALLSLPEDERRVRYSRDGWFPEPGVVTSVSDRFAFVRYEGGTHSKATDPADLTLIAAPDVTERRRQSLRSPAASDGKMDP